MFLVSIIDQENSAFVYLLVLQRPQYKIDFFLFSFGLGLIFIHFHAELVC